MVAILDFGSKPFSYFVDLQVAPILPTKFQVNWPFYSGGEFQDDSHGGHLGFQIKMIFPFF